MGLFQLISAFIEISMGIYSGEGLHIRKMEDPDWNNQLHGPAGSLFQVFNGIAAQRGARLDLGEKAVGQVKPFVTVHPEGTKDRPDGIDLYIIIAIISTKGQKELNATIFPDRGIKLCVYGPYLWLIDLVHQVDGRFVMPDGKFYVYILSFLPVIIRDGLFPLCGATVYSGDSFYYHSSFRPGLK
jgi:hypothetical protein